VAQSAPYLPATLALETFGEDVDVDPGVGHRHDGPFAAA